MYNTGLPYAPDYGTDQEVSRVRVNDVGGLEGFGPLEIADDEPPFHADWEAHVLAINRALLRRGVYTLDEFRDAIERMPPPEYLTTPYYERWWNAVCTLLREKGVVDVSALASHA
jgi:hypothetical protein